MSRTPEETLAVVLKDVEYLRETLRKPRRLQSVPPLTQLHWLRLNLDGLGRTLRREKAAVLAEGPMLEGDLETTFLFIQYAWHMLGHKLIYGNDMAFRRVRLVEVGEKEAP